jgi:uncharacterized OB-fold protein
MIMPGVPAIEGWFTVSNEPALIGKRCTACGTVAFPPTVLWCPNPRCTASQLKEVPLSRIGRIWSYTNAEYQPPPPYVPTSQPYEPFAIAAVELEAERLIVLGQVARGFGTDDLAIGQEVELVIEPLEVRDGVEQVVWKWRPTSPVQR